MNLHHLCPELAALLQHWSPRLRPGVMLEHGMMAPDRTITVVASDYSHDIAYLELDHEDGPTLYYQQPGHAASHYELAHPDSIQRLEAQLIRAQILWPEPT